MYKCEFEKAACTHTVSDDDCFLIMASDGVWEFISSQEAVDIVSAKLKSSGGDAEVACKELIQQSAVRWKIFQELSTHSQVWISWVSKRMASMYMDVTFKEESLMELFVTLRI